eukprot:121797-Amphidinium_carterae.1
MGGGGGFGLTHWPIQALKPRMQTHCSGDSTQAISIRHGKRTATNNQERYCSLCLCFVFAHRLQLALANNTWDCHASIPMMASVDILHISASEVGALEDPHNLQSDPATSNGPKRIHTSRGTAPMQEPKSANQSVSVGAGEEGRKETKTPKPMPE